MYRNLLIVSQSVVIGILQRWIRLVREYLIEIREAITIRIYCSGI
jgi:hypothetical protein